MIFSVERLFLVCAIDLDNVQPGNTYSSLLHGNKILQKFNQHGWKIADVALGLNHPFIHKNTEKWHIIEHISQETPVYETWNQASWKNLKGKNIDHCFFQNLCLTSIAIHPNMAMGIDGCWTDFNENNQLFSNKEKDACMTEINCRVSWCTRVSFEKFYLQCAHNKNLSTPRFLSDLCNQSDNGTFNACTVWQKVCCNCIVV